MSTVRTVAVVDIRIANNVTWNDEFQYGCDTDLTWNFSDKKFFADIKQHPSSTDVLLALSSDNGKLVVIDPTLRILAFNVTDLDIRANLKTGIYVYDVIMVDNATGTRTALMRGQLTVEQGVTLED